MGIGIAFLLAIGLVPPAGYGISLDPLDRDAALLGYFVAPEADMPVPRFVLPEHGSGPIDDGPGRPMAEPAGVSGAHDGPRSLRGQIRVRGAEEMTRRIPRQTPDARHVGILGVLASLESESNVGALAGVDDVDGWSADEAYGRPLARLIGEGHGTDGFDMVGTGRGGCWPGDEDCGLGTVGVGPGLGFGGVGRGTTCEVDTCVLGLFGRGLGGGIMNLEGRDLNRRPATPRDGRGPPALRRVSVQSEQGLTREQIRRALRPHRDALRHCYADARASAGGEDGTVEVGIVIASDGRVLESRVVGDTLGGGETAPCIAGALRRVEFPTAEAPTVATVPFSLDVFGG
jgi:hypothetical protein